MIPYNKGRSRVTGRVNLFLGGTFEMRGTVKWFSDKKGFGFISDQEGNDVFVHFTGIAMDGFKTLKEGADVDYEVVDGNKGPQAVNVTVVQ